MNIRTLAVLAGSCLTALVSCNQGADNNSVSLESRMDSVSYAIGVTQAKQLYGQLPEIETDALNAGYRDVADSNELKLTEEEMKAVLSAFSADKQKEQMEKQRLAMEEEMAQMEAMYGDNKQASIDFLEANKENAGVNTTTTGLQYMVLKEGKGKKPNFNSNVTVHYHGTTIDGNVFDSSVDRNEPATFALNRVIKGWTEGVAMMKEGSKYKFFIPADLAYGASPPQGAPIKPFSALIFEVELISVND